MNYQEYQNDRMRDTINIIKINLFEKYSDYANMYMISNIDNLIEEKDVLSLHMLREEGYAYQQVQYLKRQYRREQFKGKIDILTEYYRFHRNIPRYTDKNLQDILGWYYNKYRHIDYKKMKHMLKQQEGISMTTQKSLSSFSCSNLQIKSRYSNMLVELQQNNSDSLFLKNFCEQFQQKNKFKKNKLLKKDNHRYKLQDSIKSIHQQDKKFEEYLKQFEKKKKNINFRKIFYNGVKQLQKNQQSNSTTITKRTFKRPLSKNHKQSIQKQKIKDQHTISNGSNGLQIPNINLIKVNHQQSLKILQKKKSQLKIKTNQNNFLKEKNQQNKNECMFFKRLPKKSIIKRNTTADIQPNREKQESKIVQTDRGRSKSTTKLKLGKNQQNYNNIMQKAKSSQKFLHKKQNSQKNFRIQNLNEKKIKITNRQSTCKIYQTANNQKVITIQSLLNRKLQTLKPKRRIF